MAMKKKISARMALLEISFPHDGPTSVKATSLGWTPASLASSARTFALVQPVAQALLLFLGRLGRLPFLARRGPRFIDGERTVPVAVEVGGVGQLGLGPVAARVVDVAHAFASLRAIHGAPLSGRRHP